MQLNRRIYRLRPLSAVFLCLPGILLCIWYAWSAFASFDRYRRLAYSDQRLDLETYHIFLYDTIRRDLRRMLQPSPPSPSKMKQFKLHFSSGNLEKMYQGARLSEKRPYIPAKLEVKGRIYDIKAHLRGERHWHILGAKKSLKLRLPKGELFEGYRVFNLINDPTPMVVGEQFILNLARKRGILTPLSSFVRVEINGLNHGVYLYETQPDESLLRLNYRFPGSMYSGNLEGKAALGDLWESGVGWKKVAAKNNDEKEKTDDLKRFLSQLRSSTLEEFADFARNEMDLKAFATFEAIDIIFGGNEHDFRSNQKLYFDPYKGRWEPVAWSFRGFKHDPYVNRVENPILLRLKYIPEYLTLRNRILYKLLVGPCSVSTVRKRAKRMIKKLAPELMSDPYWDAYKLLPGVDDFHRRMVRPMSLRRLAATYELEMTTYAERHEFLMDALERNPLYLGMGSPSTEGMTPIKLVVDGLVGARLIGMSLSWPKACEKNRWQLFWGTRPLTAEVEGQEVDFDEPIDLNPGVKVVPRQDKVAKWGKVRTQMVPMAYHFQLKSACRPDNIVAVGIQQASEARIRSKPLDKSLERRLPKAMLKAEEVPHFRPGEVGPHPQTLATHQQETIHLGPEPLVFKETMVFKQWQTVAVAPGTQLRMGRGASLIFLGPVTMRGTEEKPIRIEPVEEAAWGGVAVQGQKTAGSTFSNVIVLGGTEPKWRLVPYPAMFNIHDTKRVLLDNCRFMQKRSTGDMVHAAYVKHLTIEDSQVLAATEDAFDLEFVEGTVRHVTVNGAKDECLDLMGNRLEVIDSVFIGCDGNGISAGEESEVHVRGTMIAKAKVGVLAKNASTVELFGSLLYRDKIGIRVYKRTTRFAGNSQVGGDALYLVESKREIKTDEESQGQIGIAQIHRRLPPSGNLEHLRNDVLGLQRWDELPKWLSHAKKLRKAQP